MRWNTVLLPLGSLLVLFSACKGTLQGGRASSVPTLLPIAIYTAAARIQPGTVTPLSVSCRSGEQMLGGGFASFNLFEYAASIEASYPSSATTWTVLGAAPASFFDLEIDVYCSSAPLSFDLHIVHATGTPTSSVTCPQKTVVLSGGFSSSQPAGASRPQHNGWMSASPAASTRAYALCAASQLVRSHVVTTVFNAHSSSHSQAPDGSMVLCPGGQVAIGGGFEGEDLIPGSKTNGSSFAGWSVTAGGDADVTIFGLCAQLLG
jgi:hypothetical protein